MLSLPELDHLSDELLTSFVQGLGGKQERFVACRRPLTMSTAGNVANSRLET